jgi:DNA polymerase-3 subunit delta
MAGTSRRGASRGGGRKTDPSDLASAIRSGEIPPVLILTGDDHFTREAIIDSLRSRCVPGGEEAFNYTSASGDEVSGGDLADMAETLPMGGDRRLIVVRRAEAIPQADAAILARYAASPAASTVLAFVCDGARAPILTALHQSTPVVDCAAPRDYQLAQWLERQAGLRNIRLDPGAARLLASIAGEDYVAAISYLDRAALSAAGPVTRRAIEDLLPRSRDTNRFHLGDAILSREPARAIKILRDLFDAGETGYTILGLLESQLRKTLALRARVSAGESPSRVIQSIAPRLPPAVRARQAGHIESFDEKRIIGAFRIARETDRAIKSRSSGTELARMEAMIWRITAL